MARRVHYPAFERLSAEAQFLVLQGLRNKWTYKKISAQVKARTGGKFAESSVARFASQYEASLRMIERRQEQAAVFINAVKAGNVGMTDMATALVAQAFAENADSLAEADPLKLSRDQIEREKLRQKDDEIAFRREELDFNKRKFEAMERKLEQVKEKAAQAKQRVALNPEEAARQIDELYGLTQN